LGYLPLRLRLKGPYFALVTMAFGLVIVSVIHNWVSLTGGPLGLTSIPAPDLFGFKFTQRRSYYYLPGSLLRLGDPPLHPQPHELQDRKDVSFHPGG
jgi:ABC-type branched-subunit amino acid transport system permease subunit